MPVARLLQDDAFERSHPNAAREALEAFAIEG
jgi:hypothetical protein